MRKTFVLVLACIITVQTTIATSQTRRRGTSSRSATAAKAAAEKSSAEIKAGRERIAAQIKTLTYFIYLLGGIAKEIESVDHAISNHEASPVAVEQNERNKTKVRDSIRNVREGLDKLEIDFRAGASLKYYYTYLAGVASAAATAENQATANRLDDAGRSLLKVVAQLADTLAAMR